MFNTQLIIGLIVNILTSLAPRIPAQGNEHRNLIGFIVGVYYISFLTIVLSPGNKFVNLCIALALHFIVNPLIAVIREKVHF